LKKQTKYRLWFLFLLCITGFIIYYQFVFSTNYYPELSRIERNFSSTENELDNYLQKVSKELKEEKKNNRFNFPKEDSPFFLHIYADDTLVYWNTNKLPVSKFADLHFPTSGIKRAQNGWYYVKLIEKNGYTIAGSFLIKREYTYQNSYLKNNFSEPFQSNFQSYISLDEASGFPIYSNDKQYLFSIVVNEYQPASEIDSLILMGLLLVSVVLFLFQISMFIQRSESKWVWLFPLGILLLRYFSLQFFWFSFMQDTELFKASLYGTSFVFPNFFEYILNIFLILIFAQFFYVRFKRISTKNGKLVSVLLILSLYPTWMGIIYLFKGLIENSSIPLHIETFFKLNIYSLISIFSIAVIGFIYFIIGKSVVQFAKNRNMPISQILYLNLIFGTIYFITDFLFVNQLIYGGLFPVLFICLIIFLEYKDFQQKYLITGIGMLALYAFVCALTIGEFNKRKDKSERELYASQLVTERDIVTEMEYNKLEKSLHEDKFLQRMISSEKEFNHRDFEEAMERRHFNGFWERYECLFFIFKENQESLSSIQNSPSEVFNGLSDIIKNNSERSEVNPSIYFVKDYTDQYSYIIRQELYGKNEEKAILFVALKSKKIPEEIGFPRLLISSESSALQHLENYSVAKYHKNKLVSQYGNFNYPITFSAFKRKNLNQENNFDYNGYNHFIHYKSEKDVVVLSGINSIWIDDATSFSYLFCFFGLLLLPVYLRFYSNSFFRNSLALSVKIQAALIGIVLISLIASGLSSGFFVKNQYKEYSEIGIKEKAHAVGMELKAKNGKLKSLSIQENGASLNYQLINLSKIFNTDINLYDTDGFLVGTSRQKVFNSGLLSEQINSVAKRELAELEQSDFIHKENIGLLNFDSAYSPLYNNSGKLLGFINLQHFGQQEESEHQIQQFLVSVINIFVLLLAVSIIVAIIVANWITNPLQMLQERFSKIHLGQSNQRIIYNQNDEIGALVKSYNQKIEELEFAAQQLAQSERESAWRDMAKQVAHEIKNPLTPMKLSVQHLMRSFDPTDEKSQEKINKVSQSLIEQIDVLTKIANEFSNFSKMPEPQFETVDIVQIILNSTELFKQSTSTKITNHLPEHCFVKGDKEQLLRVFNNLVKNGLQAVSEKEDGQINIHLTVDESIVKIVVSDNGIGISEEQKIKIFTPYFTTKSTGSGIGLAMVKQIILNHRGNIYFESEENKGTSFFIELALQPF
jgi:two-component system nitrogen regulation sensor histidine kinase NtrY